MTAAPSLKALAELKTDGVQKATYFKLRADVIEFEPGFNLREEGPELDAHIDRIKAAMRAGAYLPPIDVSVVEGRVIARDGHCRTRAALALQAEGVEYLLEARQVRGNEADAVLHMLGSDQGRKFSPLEQGRGYLRLLNMGLDVATIAARLGVSRTTIENGLALAEAPVAVQKLVAEGKVAGHTALKTVRKLGAGRAAAELAKGVEAAAKAGKTKATGKHINTNATPSYPRPPAPPAPPKVEPVKLQSAASIVERLAAMNPVASIPHGEFAALVKEARELVQSWNS